MSQFWTMSQDYSCVFFIDYWRELLTTVKMERVTLTLEDVVPKLWTPVFARCEELLKQLMDYSLSLPTVDLLFKGKQTKDITHNVKQLHKGVEMCRSGKEVKDFKWIKGVVDRMEQFWLLSGYAEAAQAFLELRNALKLTGDFQLVENVASQVSIDSCSSNHTPSEECHCPTGHQLHEGPDTAGH